MLVKTLPSPKLRLRAVITGFRPKFRDCRFSVAPVWEILDLPLNMEFLMISTLSFTQVTFCVRPWSIKSPFEFVKFVECEVKADMTLIERQ